jgi:hypothetical protein
LTSLPTGPTGPTDADIANNVRLRSGLDANAGGPSDAEIVSGVRGFARQFRFWYNRVLDEAVPKYQRLIIDRINPMIRGMQLEGLSAQEVASRLVSDYAHRNYVTAGGWALEQLAIDASPRLRKSAATGIDAEWYEPGPPLVVNLYVIKSGTVTRNSDILKALKTHGQEAQKRLLQTDKKAIVRVHYIVTAGQKSSTFHDGVYRPSSAEFWAQTFAIDDEKQAIDLALAMAQEAGTLLRGFANEDALRALEAVVAAFIATPDDSTAVDWTFLAERNMIGGEEGKADSKVRHARAQQAVKNTGYSWPTKKRRQDDSSEQAASLAQLAASLTPEIQGELSEVLLPEDE